MPSATKHFIFTDQESGTVVLVKRSLGEEFFLGVPGLSTHLIASSAPLGPIQPFSTAYSPLQGLTPAPPANREKLELLRRKAECAIFLRTVCGMLIKEIRRSLSLSRLRKSRFRGEAFRSYFRLVLEERRIVLGRVRSFLASMEEKLGAAQTIAELDRLMAHFRENVNLGVYSVANQERKGIDG